MKIPFYLRIVLPLTIAACGYAMWTDSTTDESTAVRAHSVKVSQVHSVEKKQTAPQLAVVKKRNLFPYQGRPLIAPAISPVSDKAASLGTKNEALAPVPVRAPPFPFRVSGIWVDGPQRKIILTKGDQTIILCRGCDKLASPAIGDVIDGNYRLEKIENERITFTYLPLKLEQIVDLDKALSGTGN